MDPYKIKIGGVVADPYRIAIEYGLDSILGQALKKILRCGRKHKSAEEDAREVITTMERWLEIQQERAVEAAYAGLTQEQIAELIAERNRQLASNAAIVGFVSEEAPRRLYPNPDYVDAEDDTVHVDLSKLSGDELTAAGFPEDGIVREVLKQSALKTNMEKLLDERDGETSWP